MNAKEGENKELMDCQAYMGKEKDRYMNCWSEEGGSHCCVCKKCIAYLEAYSEAEKEIAKSLRGRMIDLYPLR